jgi:hypothetical protein
LATTSWLTMRREWARFAGYDNIVGLDGGAWTTTTNVPGSNAVITSTELRDAGFDDFSGGGSGDDSIENLFLLLLGSNNDRLVRRVASYDASTGAVTGTGTDFSSESGSIDFELHRYNPTILRARANDARQLAFPLVHVPLSRYLFTAQSQVRYDVPSALVKGPDHIWLYKGIAVEHANNILTNGDFEDFTTGTPDSWSATTLDTAEETESTSPFNYVTIDGSSVRCTSQTGSAGTLLQNISSPGTHSGQRLTFQVWVYCLTSGKVRTQIDVNSTNHTGTTGDGGEHRGTGWELLTHFEDSLITLSTLRFGVRVDSDATDNTEFYVDSAVAVVGPRQEPETRPQKLLNWTYRDDTQGTTVRQHVTFPYTFPNNALLRFEGKGYLSEVTAETDTMEIAKPQNDIIYAYMARELYEEYVAAVPDADRSFAQRQLTSASRRMNDLAVHAMRSPRHEISPPDWGS